MVREKELIATAIMAAEDALTALNFALDKLLVEKMDEMTLLVAVHDGLKGVYTAREAVEVVLGLLKELQRRYQLERLERRGEER